MTTAEIIAAAEVAGVSMSVAEGKLVLNAPSEPAPELITALREHKPQIISALTNRHIEESESSPVIQSVCQSVGQAERQGYGLPPDEEIPMAAVPPRLSQYCGALLTSHILRQGRPVLDWAMRQANHYWEAFQPSWTHVDCEHAAALDALFWQRNKNPKFSSRWDATGEAISMLEGLEEAAQTIRTQ